MSEKKVLLELRGVKTFFQFGAVFSTRSGTMCRRSTTWTWTSTRGRLWGW